MSMESIVQIDKHALARLVPLNALLESDLVVLAKNLYVEHFDAGTRIDLAQMPEKLYLLAGQVSLYQRQQRIAQLNAEDNLSRYALNRHQQKNIQLLAESDIQLVRVDIQACSAGMLSPLKPMPGAKSPPTPSAEETATVKPKSKSIPQKKSDSGNSSRRNVWMERVLRNPLFRQLPPGHLRRLIAGLEEIPFKKGQVILSQGTDNKYFFIIKKGQCVVTQNTTTGKKVVNSLETGQHFGSTSLLAEIPQPVAVEAGTSGVLMRLNRQDFYRWLIYPLNRSLTYKRCLQKITAGAQWIDVRTQEEFQAGHLPGSLNLPLESLYLPFETLKSLLPELQPGREFILYSGHKRRATAALFRLLSMEIEFYVLDEGFNALEQVPAAPKTDEEPQTQLAEAYAQNIQALKKNQAEQQRAGLAAANLLAETQAEARRFERQRSDAQQRMQEVLDETEKLLPKNQAAPTEQETASLLDLSPLPSAPSSVLSAEPKKVARKKGYLTFFAVLIAIFLLWAMNSSLVQTRLMDLLIGRMGGMSAVYTDNMPSIVQPGLIIPKELETSEYQELFPSTEVIQRTFRDRLKNGALGPIMVEIPGDQFLMGSSPGKPYPDEQPQTRITLENFALSIYEITFEDYRLFAEATQRRLPDDRGWGRGRQPLINVTWEEAVAYTQWLSTQTGQTYRLPTEREWEYAAGAHNETTYWWGNHIGQNHANCAVCGSPWDTQQTSPVGSFPPNTFGLYDMVGNVKEWMQECRHINYQGMPTDQRLWPGGDCSQYPLRGGSYRTYPKRLRTTSRDYASAQIRSDEIGFRVMRVMQP